MNMLTVPIRVEAFLANGDEPVATTGDRFNYLPYVNQNFVDVNPDMPNLPSAIDKEALSGDEFLPEGVHLHWRLPHAMSKGDISETGIDMPAAPNRWLVRRIHDAGTQPVKEWIVESDYLYPQGVIPERAVAIPAIDNGDAHQQPWEYLGRQIPREQWEQEPVALQQSHRYLPKLTTLGWGSAYFANLYGDCCSVFGFYDDELTGDAVKAYRYEVFGWYSDPANDYANTVLNVTNATSVQTAQAASSENAESAEDHSHTNPSDTNSLDADVSQVELAKAVANWQVQAADSFLDAGGEGTTVDSVSAENQNLNAQSIGASVCYGKVTFDDNLSLKDTRDETPTALAMAKTSAEAAAVFLSKKHTENLGGSSEEAVALENQILALLLTDDIQGQDVDHINHLKVARHREEFSAIESGKKWASINEVNVVENITDEDLKQRVWDAIGEVRHTLAKGVKRLNTLQSELNQSQHRCAYHRRNLYNDWSKYLMRMHPADGSSASGVDASSAAEPSADEIRLLMTEYSIPALQTEMNRRQELLEQVASQAAQFEEDYATWKIPFLKEGAVMPEKVLELQSGARYWKANDPYLLLEGGLLADDGELTGTLTCLLHENTLPTSQAWLFANVDANQWQWHASSENHWQQPPWSPLFVEWEVNIYPDDNARENFEGRDSDYSPDFVNKYYRIPLNDSQLGLPSASADLVHTSPQPYTLDHLAIEVQGRALVSDGIKKVLDTRMHHFINEQKSALEASAEAESDANTTTLALVEKMQSVAGELAQSDCALVSLSGLNDQLMMYSDRSVLEINDPFRFIDDDAPHVSEQVRALLSDHSFKLPEIDQRFVPIKSGVTKLAILRIVDRFGRIKEVDCSDVLRPSREVVGNAVYSPPRVMQPLRLSFEWIDKQKEKAISPIQGWLGYNTFDETLNLFDDDGEFMGLLNSDGEWCDEFGAIQTLQKAMYRPLREYVIKLMSFHSTNRISQTKFIDAVQSTHSVALGKNGLPDSAQTLWQQLLQAGALHALQRGGATSAQAHSNSSTNNALSNKALLVPFTQGDWQRDVKPKTGLDFEVARSLFLQSRGSNNYWPKLKKAIREGVENIEPLSGMQQAPFGSIKPLAIVLARLDLHLLGGPEIDKSREAMKLDLTRFPRTNRGYTNVQFPIKLGEFNNLEDGLVAYWQVFDGYELREDGYFPQSYMDDIEGYIDAASFNPEKDDFVDKVRGQGVANLTQSLSDAPLRVLMLMDPEAPIHATTGVVPKKVLNIPSSAFESAVKRMQGRYFVAPMLSPSDDLSITVPSDGEWVWQYPTGEKTPEGEGIYRKMWSEAILDKAQFIAAGADDDDWQWLQALSLIRVLAEDESLALLEVQNEPLSTAVQLRLNQLVPYVQQALQPSFNADNTESGASDALPSRVSLVEGWLSASTITLS